jgi:hypothetical protein
MRNDMIKRTIGLVLALGVASSAQAQERTTERDFSWEGRIPNGRWLFVRNLNGGIRVDRATGDRVEVTAEKRWRRGNPEDVRIEVRKGQNGDDVIICALWFDNSECDEDGYRTRRNNDRWNRNNDVNIEFTVRLPEGVKLATSTVNGSLRIDGATSEVEAGTVNGSVVATSSGGPVNATTVNGNIEVRMRELGREALNFETVNGSIEVYVPDGLDADVDLRTVNGGIRSDFPLTVSGRLSTRHVRATIGRGGRRLEFKTVNGNVELRKF